MVEGKGGHHRVVPAANRFFDALGAYLHDERPETARTDRVFVVLKGPRRGLPLSAEGLDEILAGARRRAGLEHATCHELRHTCLTRLREAGMALEAVQAQAGHLSIESTRVYLHLANDCLAGEYRRAAELIDADSAAVAEMLAVKRRPSGERAARPRAGRSRAVPGSVAAAQWAQIRAAAPQVTATIQRYLQRLAAFLDATLFKVIYAWGLRRREAAMLDVTDFAPNPAAPGLGGLGVCHVRYGKAMKGSPPRRRAVATVMPWAAEALAEIPEEVRPRYGASRAGGGVADRAGRAISPRQIDDRFAQLRGLAGLPDDLSVHCLRHSYVSRT